MQNRQESLEVASPSQLWFPSLDSASSDSCIVFWKSAYRLRMTVPNLSIGALLWGVQCSLQSCFDESDRLNAAFVFLCIDHVDSFWETQTTKSRKVSWRVFSKRQSGPASSRIPDRPNLNFDRSRMVLRQECFGMQSLPQCVQKTNWQAVRETQESIDARAREKKPVDMVTFSATVDAESPRDWPKTTVWQQCDRDANDATKSGILRCRIVVYDFDTVSPGPKLAWSRSAAERCTFSEKL